MNYFSYGSNMSSNRLKKREIRFYSREKGILKGYRFVINKMSYKNKNIGYANIVKSENDIVEGILYNINEEDIKKLDIREGFPIHYNKYNLPIFSNNIELNAIVYIANKEWTSDNELYTTKEYKNYILEGKEYLSNNYYNFLNSNIKIFS